MTELEHLELLLAVVRVAPKELCAGIDVEYCTAWFDVTWDPEKPAQLRLDNDMIAAQACFAMLDAMEAVVPEGEVWLSRFNSDYIVCGDTDAGLTLGITLGEGATRAEAIARAFVAVFGGKDA